jgi:transposase
MLARMGELTLTHERIDDLPLLIGLGQTLGLDTAVDAHLRTHGLQQGLSNGQLTIVWLAYILSESNHRKSGVEDWAWRHRKVLGRMIGQPIRRVDCTDDRLGNLLHRFSDDTKWAQLETAVWQAGAQVYALETTQVRMDSTTTCGHHRVTEDGVMQHGHSKDHRPDLPQLKLMAAFAEPAGQWIASDIYPGQRADEGLYLPLYQRVRSILGQSGLLYIGDCKLAPLATRAQLAVNEDYYLTRLPRNLVSAKQWQAWEAQRDACDNPIVYRQDGEVRGKICEWQHSLETIVDGHPVIWEERLQWVYSPEVAVRQQEGLARRLQRAEADLQALTPEPGRGKRVIREVETLQTQIAEILKHHRVRDLLEVRWEMVEKRTMRYIGRGRGGPNRPQREVLDRRYRITEVERCTTVIAALENSFGWQMQITNAPVTRLTAEQATAAYRGGWHIEHSFHKVKDRPIGLSPLFVWQEDQIVGLTRLLTLALRLLTLIETQIARGLTADGSNLTGLYEGQPKRATQTPTASRLLKAVSRAEITLTEIHMAEHREWHLTPLPPWLSQVMRYLKLPPDLYENLTVN